MKEFHKLLAISVCLVIGWNGATAVAQDASKSYYDLGAFHRPVSANTPLGQTWFDRGLAMCYAFNHEEAVRCFEHALAAEPGLAMAWWGMAYALGPNINNLEIAPHQIAQASLAVRMAELHAQTDTPLERQLIAALGKRYATPVPEDRDPLNQAYVAAMRDVYQGHKDNPLVAALFAESLMTLRAWSYWSPEGEPAPETPEIIAVLEDGLKGYPNDPALCHLYIHAIEASPTPEKALPAADRLRDAMPGAGHLVHMPSHIYVWVGDYEQVITTNQKAIVADAEFVRREGSHNFYTFYRVHNYHFLVYGAMFDGQYELALRTARALKEQIPVDMLREMTDYLDAFVPMELHVLIRFGRWEDILKVPEPIAILPVTRSVWHYARALAYAATGRVTEAELEQQSFAATRATVPETSILFKNTSLDILGVAEAMIAGEIAYRRGEFDQAFAHLRQAVQRDDAMNYDEPWAWMQPARHALGALLLEQGQVAEAETVYKTDLKRHPKNPWALHGLVECAQRQGRENESLAFLARFKDASLRTDINIECSCFCRTNTSETQ